VRHPFQDDEFLVVGRGALVELEGVAVASNAPGLSPTTMHSGWVSK
jgi:hypothetical protein